MAVEAMTDLVHFPSDRVGLTWCGLRLDIRPGAPVAIEVARSANGLLFVTSMGLVTCPGCDTGKPAYPDEEAPDEEAPADSLWFEDRGDEQPMPWLHIGNRGEWYAFRMTPGKARAWAALLTDFAEGRSVPARPAGEERSPWMPEFYERKGSSR